MYTSTTILDLHGNLQSVFTGRTFTHAERCSCSSRPLTKVGLPQLTRRRKQDVSEKKEMWNRSKSFELRRKCKWQHVTSVDIISFKFRILFDMTVSL